MPNSRRCFLRSNLCNYRKSEPLAGLHRFRRFPKLPENGVLRGNIMVLRRSANQPGQKAPIARKFTVSESNV